MLSWKHWIVLVVMNVVAFSVAMTTTSVMSIVNTIGVSLHVPLLTLQWTVNAYLLASASFIIFSGRVSAVFGQRNCFVVAVLLFIVGSVVVAFSDYVTPLIVGRILQGLGAAAIAAESLAILKVSFPPEKQAFSVSTWGSAAGLGFAMGPLVGGACTMWINWRALFWLTATLLFLMLMLFLSVKPENLKTWSIKKMDLIGFILLIFCIVPFVLGMANGNAWRWDNLWVIGLLTFGIIFFFILWVFEIHTPLDRRLIHFEFFKNPLCILGCVGMFFNTCLLIGILYFVSHYLQFPLFLDYSYLKSGVAMLPFTAGFLLTSLFVGKIRDRFGFRLPLTIASLLLMGGFIWLCFITVTTTYLFLWAPFLLLGLGLGFNTGVFPALMVCVVPNEFSRAASGLANMCSYLGGIFSVTMSTLFMFLMEHSVLIHQFNQLNVPIPIPEQLLINKSLLEHPQVISHAILQTPFALHSVIISVIKSSAVYGFRVSMIFYAVIGLLLILLCFLLGGIAKKD